MWPPRLSGGRLLFGVLWDYLPPRVVLLGDYVLIASGAVLLLAAAAPLPRALYVVLFGLGYGGLMPLVPLTVVAYFGPPPGWGRTPRPSP